MISLDWPWLLLLLPLPLLLLRFKQQAKKQEQAYLYMPLLNDEIFAHNTSSTSPASLPKWLTLFCIWALVVIAAAQPIKIGDNVELPNTGRDLLIAVDISGSMQIPDMSINGSQVDRLTLVKHVLTDFIKKRQGDRLGLILFGSNAYIQAPLTFDTSTVSQLLNEAQIGFAGEATAVGDAIGLGIKRLANNPDNSRVMILLTDGQTNAGEVSPMQAAQLAAQEHVVIYTVGIGSDQMMSSGFFGMNRYNASQDLDEKTLTTIANTTHGKYFRARNQADLDNIYTTINQLESIDQKAQQVRPKKALYFWPLMVAMVISVCGLLVLSWQSRVKP